MTISSVRNIRSTDTWVLDENGTVIGIQDSNGSHQQLFGAGGGSTTFAGLTDKTTADLPAINTPLATALAAKATAYASVPLSANTTLTRAAHYNRLIVVDTTAGNITLTATGTDALVGDFVSVEVIGGNSVTLAGVTAQSGYTLTAVSGGTVEAKCTTAASLIAATRTVSAGGSTGDLTVALTDASFTSNNLNLLAAHTNCVLDLSAVTIPVTLTWQTDANGGYDTTSCKLRVLAGPVAPVAIIAGAGATLIGGVQVVEQGAWGGGHRTAANALAVIGQRKSGLAIASSLATFGISVPNAVGGANLNNVGVATPSLIDASSTAAASTFTDGTPEYGALRRIRVTATGINHSAGYQHSLAARLDTVDSLFPMVFRAGIADALTAAPMMVGLCSNAAFGNGIGAGTVEPSHSSIGIDYIVLGGDSADANMQIMHKPNGTPTTATKIDLGAAFPKSQWNAYEMVLYKNNAGTAFMAVVKNMVTKVFTVKIITSNVPRNDRAYHTIYDRAGWSGAGAALDYIAFVQGAS